MSDGIFVKRLISMLDIFRSNIFLSYNNAMGKSTLEMCALELLVEINEIITDCITYMNLENETLERIKSFKEDILLNIKDFNEKRARKETIE